MRKYRICFTKKDAPAPLVQGIMFIRKFKTIEQKFEKN
jgi:hypothetical protein